MRYLHLKHEVEKRSRPRRSYPKFKYSKIRYLDPRLIFLFASVSIAVLALLSFLFVSFTVKPLVRQKIKSLMNQSHGRKFEVNSFTYSRLRPVFGGVIFEQVYARGKVRFQYPHFLRREFDLYAPLMQIKLHWGPRGGLRLRLSINGLEVQGGNLLPNEKYDSRRLEAVSNFIFHAEIPLSVMPFHWKRQLMEWVRSFNRWVFAGKPFAGIYLSGNASFLADGILTKVFFHSVSEFGTANLLGDPDDLRKIASVIEPKYTNDDIAIASKNLLKTPKLLDIRGRAEKKGQDLCKVKSTLRFDTPRHIFWSYWLTQTFGAQFAKEATDAHEIGDSGNSEKEHLRDRINNSFGIEYAQRKLSEKETENMILTDSRIALNDET